jgi:hypothetical protein
MTNEQELRAWSLSIAVNLIGEIPETSAFDNRTTYEPYLIMADLLADYIREGRLTKIKNPRIP